MAHTASARAGEPQSHYTLVQNALEKHIIPHVTALSQSVAPLAGQIELLCKSGDDAARETIQGQFRQAVEAWAGVEFLRFGPLEAGGRRERYAFWPDPRGIMARQLRQVLMSKDSTIFEPGMFAKQSAAIQGLPALEVLLTDKDTPLGPSEASAYRCALAVAIAKNLSELAHDVTEDWMKDGGWKDKMLRPGSDNDTYKEPVEAANDILKGFLTGLQIVGDVLVKPRLDPKPGATGAYEKSALAGDYYAQSIESLEQLYDATAIESYLPEDKDWARNWAGGAWRTIKASDGAGGPAPGVAKTSAPPLKELISRITGLRQLVAREMLAAAGLTLGFNELDGD
jgi:predicted lipoprotein